MKNKLRWQNTQELKTYQVKFTKKKKENFGKIWKIMIKWSNMPLRLWFIWYVTLLLFNIL